MKTLYILEGLTEEIICVEINNLENLRKMKNKPQLLVIIMVISSGKMTSLRNLNIIFLEVKDGDLSDLIKRRREVGSFSIDESGIFSMK